MSAPFIGPAPLGKDQQLFGRDTEVEELSWRTVADRIVVLYSPSGAGKTSLLTAGNGLLADLGRRFHIPTILRVSGLQDQTLIQRLMSQLQGGGYGDMRDGDTLTDYVGRIELPAADPPLRLLLVIDQFEEVFTCDADIAAQDSFFRELGELLRREGSPVWLIVSMREEYFSWLDPFRHHVPSRLANTFRLDLLSTAEAAEAIRGPLLQHKVEMAEAGTPEDAATFIVAQLSKVRARGADGKTMLVDGKTVEPVQLQVACANIWQRLRERGPVRSLRTKDLEGFKLNVALQDYCREQLARCTSDAKRTRVVMDWIDRRLLTANGLRSPAIVDSFDAGAPTAQELRILQEAHLVRRQSRQDGEWYELSHDSLALPIRECIEEWRGKNLAVWQQLARSWQLDGEKDAYFKRLSPASRESIPDDESQACSDVETRFIDGFRTFRRYARLKRQIYLVIALALLVALPTGAYFQRAFLEAQKDAYSIRNLMATQAGLLYVLESKPSVDLASLAAVAGARLQTANPGMVAFDFRAILADLLHRTRRIESMELLGTEKSIYLAEGGGYRAIAEFGSHQYAIRIMDGRTGVELWAIPPDELEATHPHGVGAAAFVNKLLLTGGHKGELAVWDLNAKQRTALVRPPNASEELADLERPVRALAWADGFLYSGNEGGMIVAWTFDPAGKEPPVFAWHHQAPSGGRPDLSGVYSLAITTAPTRIVAANLSASEQVLLITPPSGNARSVGKSLEAKPKQGDAKGAFYSVAFSPDQQWVAGGNRAGKIHVWSAADGSHLRRIDAHSDTVAELRFLKDGRLLSASWDGKLRVWDLGQGNVSFTPGVTLLEVPRQLLGLALSEDPTKVFVSTEKGDVLKISLNDDSHPLATRLAKGARVESLGEPDGSFTAMAKIADAVGFAWAGEQRMLFAARRDQVLVSTANGEFRPLDGFTLDAEEIESIQVTDDASMLVAMTRVKNPTGRNQARAWSIRSNGNGLQACAMQFPETMLPRNLRFVAIRPKSNELVTARNDQLEFWRSSRRSADCPVIESVRRPLPRERPRGELVAGAFSPDGDELFLSNYSGRIFSFNLDGEPTVTVLKNEVTTVPTHLATSASGTIAFGDEEGRIHLLYPDRSVPPRLHQEFHRSRISALKMDPGGEWLLSASDSGIALWDLKLDTWIARACALAKREGFSEPEFQKFFRAGIDRPQTCAPS